MLGVGSYLCVLLRFDAGLTVVCNAGNLEKMTTEDESAPPCCVRSADLDLDLDATEQQLLWCPIIETEATVNDQQSTLKTHAKKHGFGF